MTDSVTISRELLERYVSLEQSQKKEIWELKAQLEKYRTYVHEGVWVLLDSPFDYTPDLVSALEEERLSFNNGTYDVSAEELEHVS